jgi:hypothetical protein
MLCREEMKGLFTGYASIPTGVAIFPRELYKPPRSWANAIYNIVHWTEQPKVRVSWWLAAKGAFVLQSATLCHTTGT